MPKAQNRKKKCGRMGGGLIRVSVAPPTMSNSNQGGKRQGPNTAFQSAPAAQNVFGPNIPASVYPKDSVKDVAESLGITNLRDNIAMALATDIEYRIRDIVQSASKYMKHAKRSRMTTSDIDNALRQKNIEVCTFYFLTIAIVWILSAIHRRQEASSMVPQHTYAIRNSSICHGR